MPNLTVSTDVDNFMQAADNAAARTSLGAPAATTTIAAGTGLTGGGDLSANRTLALVTPVAVANGGTGVAVSSGASSVVLRDASQNITVNSAIEGFTSLAASGTQLVLTVASAPSYLVTGSGGQTIKLPDATTLQNGVVFLFNNNQSSGAISVNNNSDTLVASIPSGGFTAVSLLSNSIAAGSWERHEQAPSNVTWSTNTLDYPGSITGATWNGNAVAVNRGGTGANTQQGALNALSGTQTAGYHFRSDGTNVTLQPMNVNDVTAGTLAVANGGTGATTDSTARTALSAAQSGANTDITSVTLTTGTITGVPGSANDIVNKSYADAIASSINFHEACDYATIAALSPAATYNQPGGAGVGVNATLTGGTNVALQVDGVTVSTTQRILVKNQGSAFENGIYTVTQQGDGSTVPYILTRATDYDTSGSNPNEVQAGDFILVLNSTLANTAWVQQTPAPINFGVTSLTFIQFAAAAAGVVTFSADATGLTPATATNGTVTLGGTLNVGHGGTGATTAGAALTALGAQPALTTAAPLALTLGGTGAIDAGTALFNLGCPAHYVTVRASSNQVGTATATTFTYTATGAIVLEGITVAVGDVVLFTLQTTNTQIGPWVCTTAGTTGVSQVMTRPSWFTGTAPPVICNIQRGNISAGVGYNIFAVTAAITDIVVGTTALGASINMPRGSVAVLGGNTFTGKNTFQAGSTGSGAVPFAFQAGVLMTTPQAHAVEWDGKSMYLTTDVSARTTNVVATAIPPTATSTGVVGQLAVDNTGSWLYVCTAANVWKRVLLTTF